MESGHQVRTVKKESSTQAAAGIKKTPGSTTTSGQDYEVALCSLFLLRALRITSDFFLVCNHALAGKFDDVVLFYRLEGDHDHKYRAILLQAKHRDKYSEKKLTGSNPFNLKDYLESFKDIRNQWKRPVTIQSQQIELHEISLVLYTNTGCEIGQAAVHVTNLPGMQHLQDFLNTGGRLLQIPQAQRVGLPPGPDTSELLGRLILCTEQMSVKTADTFLEEELRKVLRLTSPDVASQLNSELKRVVKSWWSEEGRVRYLTADSEEWNRVLQTQVTRLNSDTLTIDQQLKLDFTSEALKLLDLVPSRTSMSWIIVTDEFQANTVRARIFRAQSNSLVLNAKSLETLWEEVQALWGKRICPILVLDLSTYSPDEESVLLRRLQNEVQTELGRLLVVIATEEPANTGWEVLEPSVTWSVLDPATQEWLLSVNVQLQGNVVELRDIVGSDVSHVMTDQTINSLCVCTEAMKLGEAMPAPLEYYVPQCLQRLTTWSIEFDSLKNKNLLMFTGNYFRTKKFMVDRRAKLILLPDLERKNKIEGLRMVPEICSDSKTRELCCKFGVRGISGAITTRGFTSNATEFFPITWSCDEQIVVVEGLPGVGKSSFVTAMCYGVKEQFPEAWVLRVDMGQHSDYVQQRNFQTCSEVMDFLLQALTKDLRSLERDLLEHSLTVTGNNFLFLDAFDEISPDFTTKCCELLKGIAQTVMFRQMVVTTRPVTTKDVEEALDTAAFTLPIFSREEQTLFLERFFMTRGMVVQENEINSLRQSAGPVISIPLLCRMAADVLLHRQDQTFLECKNPWRRVLLYKIFVEQNIKNRVAEKFCLEASMPGVKKILESNKKQHLLNLQGLAVRKLMPVDKLSNIYVSTAEPEEKLGLVVKTGGTVTFEHQTFAEYFLGCWLSDHWRQCPQQLLRDVLLQDRFDFVATTFSWLLFEDFPLHVAVAQGDEGVVRALLCPETTDRGGRSALHVVAMTLGQNREVWELLMASGEDFNKEDDVLQARALEYAEVSRNWEFIELMKEKGATLEDLKFVTDLTSAKEVLICAIQEDLTGLAKYILGVHEGIFNETFDAKGNTPLHIAAVNNSTRVMNDLEEMRHAVNLFNFQGRSALHEASSKGHLKAARMLIENGADPNIESEAGQTQLMDASRESHIEEVELLMESGDDKHVEDKNGRTPLMEAAHGGHLDVVRLLIENGADPDISAGMGVTALMMAVSEGHLEVVKLLIENGADTNIETMFGITPLMEAAHKGHLEIVKLLTQEGADPTINTEDGVETMIKAARKGHRDVVKFFIESGTDPNTSTEYGGTVLTLAASEGHLEVVKLLIENGADPNIQNKGRVTALMDAARKGHMEVTKLLIEFGADPNIQSNYGETTLMMAAHEGHLEVVKLLIENGSDPNTKTTDGQTALMLASSQGQLEVVEVLIESGADTNAKTKVGETALMLAAREGHLEVVKLLIECGADLNAKTRKGETALMLAADEGRLEVFNLLIDHDADLNIETTNGRIAWKLEASEGHV